MTRRPMIAGNWKLNKTRAEGVALAAGISAGAAALVSNVDIVLAPVATITWDVREAAVSAIAIAGQNTHSETSGAFTGELSPAFLSDAGCSLCIVGHSERRQLFGETDAGVRAKAEALIAAGLTAIVCVGETLEQRESGDTLSVVLGQVAAALEGVKDFDKLVLAYEPIWAIGTGRTASPEDAQDVHTAIRDQLEANHGRDVAQSVRILYGGSVKPANAAQLLAQPDIDGALVGGASLSVESFVAIIQAAFDHAAC